MRGVRAATSFDGDVSLRGVRGVVLQGVHQGAFLEFGDGLDEGEMDGDWDGKFRDGAVFGLVVLCVV